MKNDVTISVNLDSKPYIKKCKKIMGAFSELIKNLEKIEEEDKKKK